MFNDLVSVTEIKIYKIEKKDDGLIGFASCVLDGKFFLNGIGIYKKMYGDGYRITFPKRRDSMGKPKNIFVPVNDNIYRCVSEKIVKEFLEYDKNLSAID